MRLESAELRSKARSSLALLKGLIEHDIEQYTALRDKAPTSLHEEVGGEIRAVIKSLKSLKDKVIAFNLENQEDAQWPKKEE